MQSYQNQTHCITPLKASPPNRHRIPYRQRVFTNPKVKLRSIPFRNPSNIRNNPLHRKSPYEPLNANQKHKQIYNKMTRVLFTNSHTIMEKEAHNWMRYVRWSAGKIWAESDAGPRAGNSSAAEWGHCSSNRTIGSPHRRHTLPQWPVSAPDPPPPSPPLHSLQIDPSRQCCNFKSAKDVTSIIRFE